MSKTTANLRDRLSEAIGDYLHGTVTTAINADREVVCTDLLEETVRDDFFNRWWCLITSGANYVSSTPLRRKINDYDKDGTLILYGAALTDDGTTKATFELHKYNPDNKTRAINSAARELDGYLFRKKEWDDTLVMGNWLPDPHLEDWSSSTALTWYTETSNATLAKTSTAAYIRGGTYSAKLTAGAANSYFGTNSDIYPRLINLQGSTIDFYTWVYPQTANDAKVQIYTLETDGTATTTTSTTTCPAGQWSRIGVESHSVPDDLSKISFRFVVATSGQYAYFDKARVIGPSVYELLAPHDFHNGDICSVFEQIGGESDDLCDDVFTSASQIDIMYGIREFTEGGYKYLRLPYGSSSQRKLIVSGYAPLEDTLSADTDTMSISDPNTELLIAYAAYKLYEMEAGLASSEDRERLLESASYWLGKAEYLKRTLKMIPVESHVRLR